MIKGILFYIALTILLLSPDIFGDDLNTGNILTNSTFGTGETVDTTGWSTGGDHGIHTHGEWGFPYQTGMDDSGGVLAFEGHKEDNVYQDVDLVGDGHLTQSQINQGFTSTMAADVWFWNSIENKLTLKQTIIGADGSVSTQIREINDHDPNRSTNGGQFTNYTNVYTHSSNTQTDFTIRAEVYNETVNTTYNSSHYGPDVDNVTLNVTYRDIPPISEDAQEIIDDIDNKIIDTIKDIDVKDAFKEEDIIFEEYIIDTSISMDDKPVEMEGVTEEFFEPVTEEVTNDTYDDTDLKEPTPTMEEGPKDEEGPPEVIENEEGPMEETTKETITQDEENETAEETESDSEESDDSKLQSEDSEEQEDIQSEDREKVDTDDRITTDVAKIAKEIAKVTQETIKNLSREDVFFKDNSLDAYKEIVFYSAKDIYENTNMGLFLQIDLSSYSGEIYAGASLSSYTDNDPVEIHRVKLLNIETTKRKLQAELEALKQ